MKGEGLMTVKFSATISFQEKVAEMDKDRLLDFIYKYDEYVTQVNLLRECADWFNSDTYNIEEFYNELYIKEATF